VVIILPPEMEGLPMPPLPPYEPESEGQSTEPEPDES
jgi:hypothetical protein